VQPSGGQNDGNWQPGQPPPAVDPWQQAAPPDESWPPAQPAPTYPSYEVPPLQSPNAPPLNTETGYGGYQQPTSDPGHAGYQQPVSDPGYAGYPQSPPPYAQVSPPVQPQYPPPQPTSGYGAYAPPPPPGYPPQPGFLPPQPKKSNTGMIVGLVAGGIVLVLLVAVGGAYAAGAFGRPKASTSTPAALPTTTAPATPPTQTPDSTATTTAPPAATSRDLATLDSSSTDQTPFQLEQFFPVPTFTGGSGQVYTRSGIGFYSGCENVGGARMKPILKTQGCGNMAVGVYLNADKSIMTGVMVIPLPSAANATNVFNALKADNRIPPEFWIWCPPSPEPGSSVCTSSTRNNAYRMWLYGEYHRYFVVAIALHTDGRAKADEAALTKTDQECRSHVIDAIPLIRQ
jgi:hypothetical protein